MMKKLLLVTAVSLISQLATAQYHETISTDRPGQAFAPLTTGQNVFQIQTGFTYLDFEQTSPDQKGDYLKYTVALRYGILENFEIQSAFGVRRDKITFGDQSSTLLDGVSLWNVGIRYNLLDGDGAKPSFAIKTDVDLTWVDEDYRSQEIAPRLMLIHAQKLSETFGLTTNWSVSWNGNDIHPTGTYVINVSFPVAGKLSGYIENYGEVYSGDFDTRWDTGLAYLLNKDLMADFSTGFGRNDRLTDWFIDFGISWRVRL
ncbi:MAG: transporter [Cytophagales bacterium]|nr:transporter [Cytophagales bacterium]